MITQRAAGRFTPSRVGIINLWDYRDEEFVFVDGWLVLRGPNGSGKTKALEVLFPFLLDGRIEPRRLNPFASEDRTMKANLLYRGQDVAHAYVWMEFEHPTADSGTYYVTIGIGLRAHRHVDKVTRWHFVTDGRVGVDFSLIDADDRPLTRKDLVSQLGDGHVFDATEEYRRAVDTRLFGLGQARYEQLLDLVLTLRKPQLAKDLNPVELSRTLQRGLRPLDDALLVEAAGSFDDMEMVARTLAGLVDADEATAAFLTTYGTYLRTHARAAADALTTRRGAIDIRRNDLADCVAARDAAALAERSTREALGRVTGEPGRLRTHLDRLKSSAAYQSHEQLADLERHVADLAAAVTRAQALASGEHAAHAKRTRELADAEIDAELATTAVTRLLGEVAREAEEANLAWTAGDGGPDGYTTRVNGRVMARRDDVRAVREHDSRLAATAREHTKATQDASAAAEQAAAAEAAETAAEAAVTAARDVVCDAVTAWAVAHITTLSELDPTGATAGALADAAARVGGADSPTLRDVFAARTTDGVTRVQRQTAAFAAQRDALVERRGGLAAERDRIAAEHDDAPTPPPTRTADRTARLGAPLWQVVRFGDHVPAGRAAAIEAALEAAGLLDAWIHPHGDLTTAALGAVDPDGYLAAVPPDRRPDGATLADVLVAEDQHDVGNGVISALLASIALRDEVTVGSGGPAVIGAGGQFALGVLVGGASKAVPEYIGATARAARRAARTTECERLIAVLDAQIADVDQQRAMLAGILAGAEAAGRALPSTEPIHAALRDVGLAANTLRLLRLAETAARARLDQAVAEQAAATLALRKVTAERNLPVERLDAVDAALGRFERAALRVEPARAAAETARRAVADAGDRRDESAADLDAAGREVDEAVARHEEKQEAFTTLSATVGDTDVHRVLAEVAETETRIATAETTLASLREEHSRAGQAHAAAGARLDAAGEALEVALTEADHESHRLRPYAHADLLSLLRCPTHLRWAPHSTPTETPTPTTLAAEVVALHDAILAATKDLTPTESSLKQSATRLTNALTDLQAQLPAAGLDHRPEWDTDDGVIVVRIADEEGLTPVAHFAERIAAQRRDQEQMLSEAERRILEDALLTQLARQIHHRTIEARDLVNEMDVQMRARRMSSGLTVGVGWQLADYLDADQREICKLLERDPARLGPDQLAMLRGHFATRIKAARASTTEQPYRELLANVLDYRQWRIFAFTLHRPGGTTEALTRARHSQLSGGEQSVSLHLPLFAAANALFSSARPEAPRLLGLDEAFAGVDETGRGELMALATKFDLDLFMTGYDLWAAYPAVTGAAHYDLSHSPVEHAVATVLLAWNGAVTTADLDGTLARALGSPETRRVPGEPAGVDATMLDEVAE